MSRTTYYNAYNCRPTYAWQAEVSASVAPTGTAPAPDDFTYFTAGETILRREVVFLKTDGLVYKASARSTIVSISASFEIGFAISGAISGSQIPVDTREGKVLDGFSGLSTGTRYFLSESAGAITTVEPPNSGSVIYQVGISKDADELIFKPQFFVRKFDP
jgi:hypothetical protein